MHTFVSCVVRSHKGNDTLVRIEDLIRDGVKPTAGERVVSGRMVPHVIKDGPYDSHRITVWSRLGFTIESSYGEAANCTLEERYNQELELDLEAA